VSLKELVLTWPKEQWYRVTWCEGNRMVDILIFDWKMTSDAGVPQSYSAQTAEVDPIHDRLLRPGSCRRAGFWA
jgi:hypothetical protein